MKSVDKLFDEVFTASQDQYLSPEAKAYSDFVKGENHNPYPVGGNLHKRYRKEINHHYRNCRHKI